MKPRGSNSLRVSRIVLNILNMGIQYQTIDKKYIHVELYFYSTI